MIFKMFTVYDSKAEFYMSPFCMKSRGEALRAFADSANDSTSNIGKYPEDFVLFYLGEYCDGNAKFFPLDAPHSLGVAIEFVKS